MSWKHLHQPCVAGQVSYSLSLSLRGLLVCRRLDLLPGCARGCLAAPASAYVAGTVSGVKEQEETHFWFSCPRLIRWVLATHTTTPRRAQVTKKHIKHLQIRPEYGG